MTMREIETIQSPGDPVESPHLQPDIMEALGRIGKHGVGIVMRDAWYIGEAATGLLKVSGELDVTAFGQGMRNRLSLTAHRQRSGDGHGVLAVQIHTKDRQSKQEIDYRVLTVPRHLSRTEDPGYKIPQNDEEWNERSLHSGLFIFASRTRQFALSERDAYMREIERHARIFHRLGEMHVANLEPNR